jgi:hypothetical protein
MMTASSCRHYCLQLQQRMRMLAAAGVFYQSPWFLAIRKDITTMYHQE